MDETKKESIFRSNSSNPSDEIADTNPFDRFLKNPGLDMLNAALPHVSDFMRKPLALYIKYMEIHRIVNDFDREEVLTACGFEKNSPNPEAMLKAMKMAGGKNASPQIDQLLNMMNLIRAYQSFNEMMQNNPEMASFLTNMMNRNSGFHTNSNASNSGTNSGTNHGNTSDGSASSPADLLNQLTGNMTGSSTPSPADLLNQLAGKDSSDLMSLLSQMLKNA